jgi:hypothetical protein
MNHFPHFEDVSQKSLYIHALASFLSGTLSAPEYSYYMHQILSGPSSIILDYLLYARLNSAFISLTAQSFYQVPFRTSV